MSNQHSETNRDPAAEVAALVKADPRASAMYAYTELQAGRLEWLAEHIRRCDFRIDPLVAHKLLELVDGSHPEFRLKIAPRKQRNSRFKPRIDLEIRGCKLAFEVALEGGFDKRTQLRRACHKVGRRQVPPIEWKTVHEAAKPYRDIAMSTLERGPIAPMNWWEFDATEDAP